MLAPSRVVCSKSEAAAILGVSSVTIDRMIRRGQIDAYKVGGQHRFRLEDVYALIGGE